MKNEFLIDSNKNYHGAMLAIYDLMNKGEANLSEEEIEHLQAMTIAAEKYEDEVLHLKPVKQPTSLSEVVELFMFENKLSQAKLAGKLGIGKPKLSQILTGERQPDVLFLKALYRKLNLDPKVILENV
ncbi:helix-turn-helix domain-containing protein [Mucilaginibacter gotjawali]|uniref:Helix-turn-helix protein n=2 Tax=Mucilaginibacter gotjawali TaxID=1550579 RepID=A0A0X8X886_9SPHI|nr:helix-turn-helix transcriptional regulator [Mucilaginibacter gotjawali]MBB3057580.1 transcriptional regulator with XRE-family HTH domain [Mucilaginibacter gotjawali]BAU55239.1 helix-turn-helix protein [Mucilaginibacter gotjawali]